MKKILKITYLQMGKILVWIHQVVKKIFKRDYLQVVKNLGVDSSNGEKYLYEFIKWCKNLGVGSSSGYCTLELGLVKEYNT